MESDEIRPCRAATPLSPALVERVAAWLRTQALSDIDLEAVVQGCCERLHGAGLPIARVNLIFSVLHPLLRAIGFTWQRGQRLEMQAYRHVSGSKQPAFFRESPYYHLLKHNVGHMRRRLDVDGPVDFPTLDALRQAGMTDYLAFADSFVVEKGQGMLGSWTTRQPGGFADHEIDALLSIQYSLAVACRMAMLGGVARSALATYLGATASERVLAGQIRRGDGETTRAAIVWGDLRDSTRMADQFGRQTYVDSLNEFFDATAGAVADAGGDILGFIGDGFLAIFPCKRTREEAGDACRRALSSALTAMQGMEEVNRRRQAANNAPLGYGLSLHIGDVMFGNVGLPERLSFSAFGSAVNETVRLEKLTKKFSTPIVGSKAFANSCRGDWDALGCETLPGVGTPMAVLRPGATHQPAPPRATTCLPRDGREADAVVMLSRDRPRPMELRYSVRPRSCRRDADKSR